MRADRLVDSLPIVLAKWPRSGAARVAREVTDQGFSSSKRSYYYEVKLHAIALRRTNRLPLPALLHLSRASQYDLQTLRELDPNCGASFLFGDKAYADDATKRELAERGTHPVTPYKRNEPETARPRCGRASSRRSGSH